VLPNAKLDSDSMYSVVDYPDFEKGKEILRRKIGSKGYIYHWMAFGFLKRKSKNKNPLAY
jgi:hypothetical protein